MTNLRKAASADAQTLWSIRTRAIRHSCAGHYPAQDVDAWASTPLPAQFEAAIRSLPFVVAELRGVVAGYGFLDIDSETIEAIFVDPDHQRRGIGRQLLRALEDTAHQAGLRQLRLAATLNAAEFYRAAGFTIVQPDTYRHPNCLELACLRMRKWIGLPQ